MSEIKSLSFPDTNAIDMSGGRFEIHGSEIIDRSWGENFAKGFGEDWVETFTGDVSETYDPYMVKLDGTDPQVSFSKSGLIKEAIGVYGFKFKISDVESDSGVRVRFRNHYTPGSNNGEIVLYYSPVSPNSGMGDPFVLVSWVPPAGPTVHEHVEVEAGKETTFEVVFLKGGEWFVRYNGVEIQRISSQPFQNVKFDLEVLVDGGPFAKPVYFTPISTYVKPYLESIPSSRNPSVEKMMIIPDNVQDSYVSFMFLPTRPGVFRFKMVGVGIHHDETEDFMVEVIDNYSKEDSLKFLVSPVQKIHNDSSGLMVCRTHGVRRVDNAGSMTARMECICDGNPETADPVHIEVNKSGSLYNSSLGKFPEFFMVDPIDPVQPKKYGRDYQFLRLHQGYDSLKIASGKVRNIRTLILKDGNRLYYGVRYNPESVFTYSFRLESDDLNLNPLSVRAVRMSDATLEGEQEFISLPTSLNTDHSFSLTPGVWLIEATFEQNDWAVGVNSKVSIDVKKTSGVPRDISRAESFTNFVSGWNSDNVSSKGIVVSVVVETKETLGSFFYMFWDRCSNEVYRSESPYFDIDLYTDSFSAVEMDDGSIRFFYLEYNGTNLHRSMNVRNIQDLANPNWDSGGVVRLYPDVHISSEPTGFYAFDMVEREGGSVDLIFSQLIQSDFHHERERSYSLVPAALGPNLIGNYKIASLDKNNWMPGYGNSEWTIPVDHGKISVNHLPVFAEKRWRGAYFYKNMFTGLGSLSLEYNHYQFNATACQIRANYDKASGRTIVTMIKEGDRVPFLISGRGGVYKNLANVDTDRDAIVHGLLNDGAGFNSPSDYKDFVFNTISGALIRSADSVFGPDGRVYTICTAYNAFREKVVPSHGEDFISTTGADRYNTWMTIIDPLILTANGGVAAPDRNGFSRGEAQVVVPMFNIYGSGSDPDYEVLTSVSIARDNQYLIVGTGGRFADYPTIHQSTSYDTLPLGAVMDEIMVPSAVVLEGEWGMTVSNVTSGGVAILGLGNDVYRNPSDYFDTLVKNGGGVIHYVRFDTTVDVGVLDVEWRAQTARGEMNVRIFGPSGSRSIEITGGTTPVPVVAIDDGVYDMYMAIEMIKDNVTNMPYTFILKRSDHAESSISGSYKYDFRRDGIVLKGVLKIGSPFFTPSVFFESYGANIGVHEMGWSALNNQRAINRVVETRFSVSGVVNRSSYPSRGVPNTAEMGNSLKVLSSPFPSLPFTMANIDGGQFGKYHWPNGFLFWPEQGTAVKGDSVEISRQFIYREDISPSSRIHKSWRSANDSSPVYIWMDAYDSGMDTFSADAFVISGTNVPIVTIVVKDREEDAWEEIGVIDLVRYKFERMRRQDLIEPFRRRVYSFDNLDFNLGKFEDIEHYLHPTDMEGGFFTRSEKIYKAREDKIWTDFLGASVGVDERFVFSSRGVLRLDEKIERRFIGFRFDAWPTYEGYFKFDSVDFGVLTDVPMLYNHDAGSGLKTSSAAKVAFIEDNQVFSIQNEGVDREFDFRYSIADGSLFMKFVSLIDRLTFSRTPVWIIENQKSKKDSVYLCLMTGDASTQVLIDEDGHKFYNVDLKFKSVRRDS